MLKIRVRGILGNVLVGARNKNIYYNEWKSIESRNKTEIYKVSMSLLLRSFSCAATYFCKMIFVHYFLLDKLYKMIEKGKKVKWMGCNKMGCKQNRKG